MLTAQPNHDHYNVPRSLVEQQELTYHKLLKRQLKKAFGKDAPVPPELEALFKSISDTYEHYEENYYLLRNATEVSSLELTEMNKRLRDDAEKNAEVLQQLRNTILDLGGNLDGKEDDLLAVTSFLRSEIEKRREAEFLIQQSENKYRGIIENLSLGMIETDLEGKIKKVYPVFTEMTGYEAEELQGKHPFDTFVPEEWQEVFEKQQKFRANGETSAYEAMLLHKNGSPVWMLISAAPILDQNGTVIGTIGIHFDITERKKMESDLIDSRIKAEQALEARERFVANISHEIRTPMNAIIGMSRLLGEANLTSEERAYQEAIQSSAKNLLVIINDVLDMSKMNAGKFEMDYHPVNLRSVMGGIIKAFEVNAHHKSIAITCNIEDAIEEWHQCDEVRLSQILNNLIGNAIKFTERGSVDVRLKKHKGKVIRFEVKDSGVGIAEDKLDTVFDQFAQEDETITRKFGGTGLGLSICKQLVELFGGEIGVVSEKGDGAMFWFELPLDPCKDGQIQEKEADLYDLSGVNVLLVEDNEMNRFLARTVLTQWNCNIREAENGAIALEMLQEELADVVLMDIQMPVMDGLTSAQNIRHELKLTVPIIALTANALKGELEKCLSIGMNGYLSKPFQPDALNNAIYKAINLNPLSMRIHHGSALQKLVDNTQDKEALLATVTDNLESVQKRLANYVMMGEWDECRRVIHSCRSVVSVVGANALHDKLSNIERDLEAGKYQTLLDEQKTILDAMEVIQANLLSGGSIA